MIYPGLLGDVFFLKNRVTTLLYRKMLRGGEAKNRLVVFSGWWFLELARGYRGRGKKNHNTLPPPDNKINL